MGRELTDQSWTLNLLDRGKGTRKGVANYRGHDIAWTSLSDHKLDCLLEHHHQDTKGFTATGYCHNMVRVDNAAVLVWEYYVFELVLFQTTILNILVRANIAMHWRIWFEYIHEKSELTIPSIKQNQSNIEWLVKIVFSTSVFLKCRITPFQFIGVINFQEFIRVWLNWRKKPLFMLICSFCQRPFSAAVDSCWPTCVQCVWVRIDPGNDPE